MRHKFLIGLLCLALAACGTTETASPTAAPTSGTGNPTAGPTAAPTVDLTKNEIKQMPIDSFNVQVMESMPVQVSIEVQGSLADSCTSLGEITQSRNGNTIEVTITTVRPKDMICAQRLEMFTRTIQLDGTFAPGEYVVRVNGKEQTIKV